MLEARRAPLDIYESFRGCQYTALAFGARCRGWGVAQSMGSTGDCFDNSMAESFFATLECELLDRTTLSTYAEARAAVFDFIEGWYNTRRRHSALGYRSPLEFERLHASPVDGVRPVDTLQVPTSPCGSRAARGFHTAHREGSPYACHAVNPKALTCPRNRGKLTRSSRNTTSRFRLAFHRWPGAKTPDPTAAPSALTPVALRAPSVSADPAPFTRLDPTMPPNSFDIGFSLNPCPRKLGAPHGDEGGRPRADAAR